MKAVLGWAAALLAIVAVYGLWVARSDLADARAAAAVLSEARAEAEQRATEAAERAHAASIKADSLSTVTARLKEQADARARVERARADSLEAEIIGLVPEGEIRDAVQAALSDLRATFESRLSAKDRIIATQDAEIVALRGQVRESESSRAALDEALDAAKSEIAVWQAEADPGIFERLRRNIGLVGGTAAGTTLLLLAIL